MLRCVPLVKIYYREVYIMAKGITVSIDVSNLQPFKDLLSTMADVLKDHEIPQHVKDKYMDRVKQIIEGVE